MTPDIAPGIPPWSDSMRSTVKRGRNRKRTTAKVIRHGAAWVAGADRVGPETDDGAIAVAHPTTTAGLLAGVRRGRFGHLDGIALAKLATDCYDLPPLLGTETRAFEEVIHAGRPIIGVSSHIAGADGTAWDGDRDGDTGRVAWPTRYRLATPQPRKADPSVVGHVERVKRTPVHFPRWANVTPLRAASDDPAYLFIGHDKVRRGETTRAQRATRRRVYEVVTLDDTRPLGAQLVAVLATLPAGERARWTWLDQTGTASVAPSGRYNVASDALTVRSARTLASVQRKADTTI